MTPKKLTRDAGADVKANRKKEASSKGAGPRKSTSRFEQKRERVIEAATRLMNERGIWGLTFVDVAESVGLSTSSVTYYFRFKEQLAAAALEATISRIEQLVAVAEAEPTSQAKVRTYLRLYFRLYYNVEVGKERPITVLSDMRSLEDAARIPLMRRYAAIFRRIREFFGQPVSEEHHALNTARAQVLTESMHWLPAWLSNYAYTDFERVQERLFDLFDGGLARSGAGWNPQIIAIDRESGWVKGRDNFLRVASRVISERGYRGASVDRIAAELNVTKGSFYHYLDAKDELVLDCFRHSYRTIANVLRADNGGSRWQHLTSTIATLLDIQFAGEWPLLRTSALQTLPVDVRAQVVARASRVALSIAGIIADGINEGSIRAVDPLIAAQTIMPGLNAAYEQHNWSERLADRKRAVDLYASTLIYGLFDDRILHSA